MKAWPGQSMGSETIHDDRRLPALTGARFIAALAVLISHFDERGLVSVPNSVIEFLDGGRTAVSFFFVLSGFVLTYNYLQISGKRERLGFYVNRIARIYPVVLLSLGLAGIGVAYALIDSRSGALLDWYSLKNANWLTLSGSFAGQLLMLTGWLPTASLNQPWNGPAWSISCEMFFYALFPYLIAYLRKLGRRGLAGTLVSGFAIQCLIIWLSRAYAPPGQRGFLVSQFPPTHLFEFVAGIIAALTYSRGGHEWLTTRVRRPSLMLATVISLAAIAAYRPVDPAYLLMSPLFGVLVLCLAVPPRSGRNALARKEIVLLGEASFSLYMIHVPLMNLVSIARPTPILGWVTAIAIVGLSVLVFEYFETGARKRLRDPLLRRRTDETAQLKGTTLGIGDA